MYSSTAVYYSSPLAATFLSCDVLITYGWGEKEGGKVASTEERVELSMTSTSGFVKSNQIRERVFICVSWHCCRPSE